VAGLAGGHRRSHRRVPGHAQRRAGNAGAAEPEAARIDIGRRVAAGAVAVERADRDMVARRAHDGDVGEGRGYGGGVTGEALGHALVRAGHGVERVVAGRGVALRARRTGRDVVRRA